jgi:opacity protein-like surface antigen
MKCKMTRLWFLGTFTLCGLLAATPAHAQAFVVGSLGSVFGGDAPSAKGTWGVGLGATARGIVGIEFEFAHTPTFFSEGPDSGNVITMMGNFMVGVPIGALRPYGVVGAGLIRQHAELSLGGLLSDFTSNDFGYSLGGGAEVTLGEHVGLRADLRHLRVRETDGLRFGRFLFGLVLKG